MKIAKTARFATEVSNAFLKDSGLNITLAMEEVPTFDVDGVTPCQDFDFWITEGKKQKQLGTLGYCSAALLPELGFKLKSVKDSTKKLFYFVVTSTSTPNVIEADYLKRCQQNWPIIAKLVSAIKAELPDVAVIFGAPSEGGWKVDYNEASLTGIVSTIPYEECPELKLSTAEEILQAEVIKFCDAAQLALSGSHTMTVLWSLTAKARQFLLKSADTSLLDAVVARAEDCGFPKIEVVTQYFEKEDQFTENLYLTALATLPQNEFAEQLKSLTLYGLEEWSAHSTKFASGFGFRVKRDKTSEENMESFTAHIEKLIRPEIVEEKPAKTSAKEIAEKVKKAKKAKTEEVIEEDKVVVLIEEEVIEEEVIKPLKKAPKIKSKK